jgi:hypothetical protein
VLPRPGENIHTVVALTEDMLCIDVERDFVSL